MSRRRFHGPGPWRKSARAGRGLLALAVWVGFCAGCATPPDAVPRGKRKTVVLENGLIRLEVAPEIGGRVLQYALGDYEYFWVNKAFEGQPPTESGLGPDGSWLNYGGEKLWPAPQGWDNDEQWPGPPDAVLDGRPHRAEVSSRDGRHVGITLTSLEDPRTGIQFSRRIRVFEGSTRVSVAATMKNTDVKPRRWGIWTVAQISATNRHGRGINTNMWAYCPINPKSRLYRGYRVIHGLARNPSFQPDGERGIMQVRHLGAVGKIGLDSHAGWTATVDAIDGYAFVQRFKYEEDRAYPDDCSVGFWLEGVGEIAAYNRTVRMPDNPAMLMTSELLSPLAELDPGASYTFNYDWYACVIGPGRRVYGCSDFGVVCEPLGARRKGARLKLSGRLGVFYDGNVTLRVVDGQDNVVATGGSIPVTPRLALALEDADLAGELSVAGADLTAVLMLEDTSGRPLGELARVKVR